MVNTFLGVPAQRGVLTLVVQMKMEARIRGATRAYPTPRIRQLPPGLSDGDGETHPSLDSHNSVTLLQRHRAG